MRGIVINPFEKKVEEINLEGGYENIQKTVGCDMFTIVRLSDDETLFLDDEGLLKELNKNGQEQKFFILGASQPFAGIGLILGMDFEGDSIGTSIPLDVIQSMVKWVDNREDAMNKIKEDTAFAMREYESKGFEVESFSDGTGFIVTERHPEQD